MAGGITCTFCDKITEDSLTTNCKVCHGNVCTLNCSMQCHVCKEYVCGKHNMKCVLRPTGESYDAVCYACSIRKMDFARQVTCRYTYWSCTFCHKYHKIEYCQRCGKTICFRVAKVRFANMSFCITCFIHTYWYFSCFPYYNHH